MKELEGGMKAPGSAYRQVRRVIVSGFVFAWWAGTGNAQSPLIPAINPLAHDRNGFRLYNLTASFGYSTLALPGSSSLPAFSLERLESDFDGTVAASFGYNYQGRNSSVSLLYSPALVRRVRSSEQKSFNQSMNIRATRRLARRWDLSLSAMATDSTLDQLLFSPATLSADAGPVASLDDLIQAARLGQYSGDQLASLLTGTPYVATPSHSLVYGSSFFSTTLNSTITFRSSSRLSFVFSGDVTRSQTRSDLQQQSLQGQLNYLIPRNTVEQGSASINYSLSPRTGVGIRASSSRVESSFSRYSVTNASVFVNRRLSPHWFAEVAGGAGVVKDLGGLFLFTTVTPGFTLLSSLNYTMQEHHLSGSYSRVVGDPFGFRAQSSEAITGSWDWQRRGRPWSLQAGGERQRMLGGILGDVRYWHGRAAFMRTLSPRFAVNFAYAYVNRPTSPGNLTGALQQRLSGYSARVTLVWSPQAREQAAATDGGGGGTGTER